MLIEIGTLFSILLDIFFLGGYLINFSLFYFTVDFISDNNLIYNFNSGIIKELFLEGMVSSIILGIKACAMVFIFI